VIVTSASVNRTLWPIANVTGWSSDARGAGLLAGGGAAQPPASIMHKVKNAM
jgi:hypothetical protein